MHEFCQFRSIQALNVFSQLNILWKNSTCDCIVEIVSIEATSRLVCCDPGLHLLPHPVQVVTQPIIDPRGQHLGQVQTSGQELAGGQGGDGVRVGQVQLKIDLV